MPTESKSKIRKAESPMEIIYHYYDIIKPKPKRRTRSKKKRKVMFGMLKHKISL